MNDHYILLNKRVPDHLIQEKLSTFFNCQVASLKTSGINAPINFYLEEYYHGEFKFELQIFARHYPDKAEISMAKCCLYLVENLDVKAAYSIDDNDNFECFEKAKAVYLQSQKDLNLEGKDIEFISEFEVPNKLLYDGIDPYFASKPVQIKLPIDRPLKEVNLLELIKKAETIKDLQLIAWNGIANKIADKFHLQKIAGDYQTKDGINPIFCFLKLVETNTFYLVCTAPNELQPGRFCFTLEGIWAIELINIDELEIIYLSVFEESKRS